MPKNTFSRQFAVAATLTASLGFLGGVQPSQAQTSFTYNNGYGETINSNGTVTGGTAYTFVTSTGNGPNGGNLSEVEDPYNFTAGTTTLSTGGRGRNFTEKAGSGNRIAASFDVPAGMSIRLTNLTVYGYVLGASSTANPFSFAHFAIYNESPNAPIVPLAAATVAGDSTFTQNYLSSATFSGTYKTQTAAGTNPVDRAIFDINLNLSSPVGGLGAVSDVVLTSGRYYLAYSVDVDPRISANDAFAVIARPTLTTGQTVNGTTYNGQPQQTDGTAQIYNNGTWNTDQPVYGGPTAPVVLDGFPYRLTGILVSANMPEPGSLALLFAAGAFASPFVVRRVRKLSNHTA